MQPEFEEFLQFGSEFTQLLEVYVKAKPERVLEIGVKHGGTLWHWIEWAQAGTQIVAVDECKQADVRKKAAEWAERRSVDLMFFKGDSHDPEIKNIVNRYGPFDFVFIDGDHSYNGVQQDLLDYTKGAKIIAFHDIVPHDNKPDQDGATILWSELTKMFWKTEEFVESWSQSGNGIGVLYCD